MGGATGPAGRACVQRNPGGTRPALALALGAPFALAGARHLCRPGRRESGSWAPAMATICRCERLTARAAARHAVRHRHRSGACGTAALPSRRRNRVDVVAHDVTAAAPTPRRGSPIEGDLSAPSTSAPDPLPGAPFDSWSRTSSTPSCSFRRFRTHHSMARRGSCPHSLRPSAHRRCRGSPACQRTRWIRRARA